MKFRAAVAIPTLAADDALDDCLAALKRQTFPDFEVIVVDNSGRNLVQARPGVRVLPMDHNTGFGAAVNAAFASSSASYLATLNDDAVPAPEWLAALVSAMEKYPDAGMCASQVTLAEDNVLDSAGMLLCADGSSKQRGHGRPPREFAAPEDVLLPSGSAALYRRAMWDQTGGFDADFFLYCEDTDLGLRAQRAGWRCLYVPEARAGHRYSHSAGRASALKAYYVERNRLFVVLKNFPARMLPAVPFVSLARYAWHAFYMLKGRGAAAQFRATSGGPLKLAWLVLKAHGAALLHSPRLWRKRRAISRAARVPGPVFLGTLRRFSIPARAVAEL